MTSRVERQILASVPLFATVIAIATPADAYAYLDPGTGSLMLQMAAAGLLGGLFTIKTYWFRIKAWFQRSPAASTEAPPPPGSAPDER